MGELFDSRVGSIFVIIYAFVSIAFATYSSLCSGTYCSLLIVVPILPWASLVGTQLHIGFPWAVYPLFVLLNASIFYMVGVALEAVYVRMRERHESVPTISSHTTNTHNATSRSVIK